MISSGSPQPTGRRSVGAARTAICGHVLETNFRSGLLMPGASSIQTDPEGSRQIVRMIKWMINTPAGAPRGQEVIVQRL
jgi:hypothetical protein